MARFVAPLLMEGANGGLLGDDARILEHVPNGFVNVTGMAGDELTNLTSAQPAALVETVADGSVIVIMLQHENHGTGQTAHSKGQMEHFGVIVDDKSRNAGGKQCIITPKGCTIPIHVRDGPPHIDMQIPVDAKMDKCPHVFLAVDSPWDPLAPDNKFEEEFCDTVADCLWSQERHDGADPHVDRCGFPQTCEDCESLFCAQDEFIAANANTASTAVCDIFCNVSASGVTHHDDTGAVIHDCIPMTCFEAMSAKLSAMPNQVCKLFPDPEKFKLFFGWASADKMKILINEMTQHCRGVIHCPFHKHFQV